MENHPHTENGGQDFVRFEKAWLPHWQMHDVWRFQGILRDIACPDRHYAWRCSLNKFPAGWYSLFMAMHDIGANTASSQRTVFHTGLLPIKKPLLSIDEESIFAGEQLQLLDSPQAMALVMQNGEMHATFCLVKPQSQKTYGQDRQIWRREEGADKPYLTSLAFPQTATSCRLQAADRQLKLVGRSVVDRAFGPYDYRKTANQYERFYFFFNNGAEAALWHFPREGRCQGVYFPLSREQQRIDGVKIEIADSRVWNNWKFSDQWNVTMPQVLQEDFCLKPMGEPSFSAPCAWQVNGIYDQDGEKLGYCLAESWIGAQSEKNRIPRSLLKYSH
ncbi:MAG: hypothetical protein K6B40_00150 [Firmicutes bacterium]|nr:hypothetical protein [Bacillota bacterium]